LRYRRTWRRRVRSQLLAHFSLACRLYGGLKPYFDNFFSFLLLFVPTALMGATLPLLVEHLSIADKSSWHLRFYPVLRQHFWLRRHLLSCPTFLLRDFGKSGAVVLSAGMYAVVCAAA